MTFVTVDVRLNGVSGTQRLRQGTITVRPVDVPTKSEGGRVIIGRKDEKKISDGQVVRMDLLPGVWEFVIRDSYPRVVDRRTVMVPTSGEHKLADLDEKGLKTRESELRKRLGWESNG